ncbi:MAG TPA: TIGR03545 family protein [Gallionella sp.]
MKNSADSTVQQAPKKQGPIRFEAIIPLAIVSGVIALYFTLFFDGHLRRGIEYVATRVNGAEVNIGRLDTSVWNASVVIGDIAMTNPELPSRNRVQIGAMNFHMIWDALLRGKVVIDEASIVDVQIDTPRKTPGYVLPVEPVKEGEGFSDKMLAQMKDEFSGNVLGDLAAIAAGADTGEQLAAMGGDLKSTAYLDELQKSLEGKNQQWSARVAALPKGEEFTALQRRLAAVKLDDLKDVAQIQASLKELAAIRDEFDAKVKPVGETGSALTSELGSFKGSISGVDKLVRDDINDLQSRMSLPSLDVSTLSRALFGMDLLGKVQQARGYMDQARSYMPAKGSKVEDEKSKPVAAPERSKGRNYAFGTPQGYPRFWLRRAMISSRLSGGASDLSGEILHVTTDPGLIGKPMVATLRGNFPQQGISGIKAELVIDHTTAVAAERVVMEVGRYAVSGRSLVDTPAVGLGFSKAEGSMQLVAELRENNVDMRLANRFTEVAIETKAQSDVVREMISASVAGLNTVTLDANVTGTWDKLDWQLTTNLAKALEQGMSRYLKDKLDAARARIEKMVNGKINEQRKRLYARQAELESVYKSELAKRQDQINKLRGELDAARKKLDDRQKALVGAQQQRLKQEADKTLDKLRLKF